MRAAGQAERLERELVELSGRVEGHNRSLARDFDRVLDVLSRRGYVEVGSAADDDRWRLTEAGRCSPGSSTSPTCSSPSASTAGCSTELDPARLAALLSTFVYEHRSPEPAPPPWFPSADVRTRWRRILATSEELAADERATGLAEHRPPDPGFAAAAYAWVAGEGFADVVADEEVAAATSSAR